MMESSSGLRAPKVFAPTDLDAIDDGDNVNPSKIPAPATSSLAARRLSAAQSQSNASANTTGLLVLSASDQSSPASNFSRIRPPKPVGGDDWRSDANTLSVDTDNTPPIRATNRAVRVSASMPADMVRSKILSPSSTADSIPDYSLAVSRYNNGTLTNGQVGHVTPPLAHTNAAKSAFKATPDDYDDKEENYSHFTISERPSTQDLIRQLKEKDAQLQKEVKEKKALQNEVSRLRVLEAEMQELRQLKHRVEELTLQLNLQEREAKVREEELRKDVDFVQKGYLDKLEHKTSEINQLKRQLNETAGRLKKQVQERDNGFSEVALRNAQIERERDEYLKQIAQLQKELTEAAKQYADSQAHFLLRRQNSLDHLKTENNVRKELSQKAKELAELSAQLQNQVETTYPRRMENSSTAEREKEGSSGWFSCTKR